MNVYVDDLTAARAKELLDEFGFDIQTAVNVFLRQVIRSKEIPFSIEIPYPERERLLQTGDDDFYNEANMEHLRKSIAQYKAGEVVEHELIEV